MNLLDTFYRLLIGPPVTTLVESLHVRLLSDWVMHPTAKRLHPQCIWKLAEGHPYAGVYQGMDFYDRYANQLAETYSTWIEVVDSIIGSQIGGIVVGEYHFQQEPDGVWYRAAFTQFYRIEDRRISSARFYMGAVKTSEVMSRQLIDSDFMTCTLSLN